MIVILRGFAFGVSAVAILALLPLVARDLLDGSALVFGVLLGAFGIGAILGGLANGWLRARLSSEAVVRLAFIGMGLAACLVGISRSVWLTSLVLLPAGASWVLALSLFNVVVQLSTPRWVVGRVLSIYQTAIFGGMTAGGWIWGALSQGFDVPTALYAAAAASVAGAAIGLRFRLPALSAQNLDPLNQFQEPPTQLGIQPRSGPIFILIEYDIDQADVPAFLAVMTDRRRIRIRDGARHWVLLRDVENPNLWKEAYHVPTWADYLRHNQRRTRMDADVTERLIALNRRATKPQVRRMIERETVPQTDDMMMKPFQDLH
jgi:MFS family permease